MPKRLIIALLCVPILAVCQPDAHKARQLFEQNRNPEAKALYAALFKKQPRNAEIAERLGDLCSREENWGTAAYYYKRFASLDAKNARAHFKRGAALSMDAASGAKIRAVAMLGDIRESFETAIALDSRHIEARWALVEYYLQVPAILGGSEQKARKYADELAEISTVDHLLARGRIEEYFDRLESAEKYYLKAHAVGNSATTLKKLTAVYAKMKRPDKAKAVSERFDASGKTSEKRA